MTIEYRHPTIDDIETITDISNRSAKELPLHRDMTVEEMRSDTFDEDDYDTTGHLLAIVDGEPAGYGGAMVQKSRQESGMNDAFLGVGVVPEHRGKGIEQHLMKHGLDFLKEKGIPSFCCPPIKSASLSVESGLSEVMPLFFTTVHRNRLYH